MKKSRGANKKKRRHGGSPPQEPPASRGHPLRLVAVGILIVGSIAGLWVARSAWLKRPDAGEKGAGQAQGPGGEKRQTATPARTSGGEADDTVAALKQEELALAEGLIAAFPDSADPIFLMGKIQQRHGNTTEAVRLSPSASRSLRRTPDAPSTSSAPSEATEYVSFSATGASLTATTVIVTVAALESNDPSFTVYVKASLPAYSGSGVYVKEPSPLSVTEPCDGWL